MQAECFFLLCGLQLRLGFLYPSRQFSHQKRRHVNIDLESSLPSTRSNSTWQRHIYILKRRINKGLLAFNFSHPSRKARKEQVQLILIFCFEFLFFFFFLTLVSFTCICLLNCCPVVSAVFPLPAFITSGVNWIPLEERLSTKYFSYCSFQKILVQWLHIIFIYAIESWTFEPLTWQTLTPKDKVDFDLTQPVLKN